MRCLQENHTTNSPRHTALMLALTAALASAALAQDFTIDWYTVDGGGEMFTAGGDFELSGTIGQPDASTITMIGGEFEITGGFWPVAGEPFCFGDLDDSGVIGIADLAQLLGSYGETDGMTYDDGDLDGDGDVDIADLAALLGVYGDICP